ncbi:hypothetical protein [Candidatus Formimonas warabiya]|nr:hypothetical protein [Candidatus Formimonas warabiya]
MKKKDKKNQNSIPARTKGADFVRIEGNLSEKSGSNRIDFSFIIK